MGDSNTAGGAGGMDEFTESYPAQLSVLLGGDEWDVRNFGKGGRTVVDTQGRAYRTQDRPRACRAASPTGAAAARLVRAAEVPLGVGA